MLKRIIAIVGVFLLFVFCSCVKNDTESEKLNDSEVSQNVSTVSDESKEKQSYESPYSVEYGDPGRKLYWQLERNAVILANKVANELADKRWEDINFAPGFPERYRFLGEQVSELEKNSHLYCVEGKILGDVYVIVTLIFSEENPEGQISRVIYTSEGGRNWDHTSSGYDKLEIVDAYTIELWQNMSSY